MANSATQPRSVDDREARRRELESEILRLGRRRNRIGGAGAGMGTIMGGGIFALRRYFTSPSEAMQNPLVVFAAAGLAAALALVVALGVYVLRLNGKIDRMSVELTMLEMGH